MSPFDSVVMQLQALLTDGDATRGLAVRRSRGGIVLSRLGPAAAAGRPSHDPRFRLTPLGGRQFGLALYRGARWEPLPFQGTLTELTEVMNTALAPWASAD